MRKQTTFYLAITLGFAFIFISCNQTSQTNQSNSLGDNVAVCTAEGMPVRGAHITEADAKEKAVNFDSLGMVWIPPGSFKMGSNEFPDAQPIHEVQLDGFWMD